MATSIQPLITVDDLEYMPEDGNRYEVIEGELFVSRAPGLPHQNVSIELATDLKNYLRANPIGRVWTTPGVIFGMISGVIPDIVYVSNERLAEIASGERVEGAPDLVIEIVSPGIPNAQRDRVVKKQLYGKYGVKEYWLIDLLSQTIEVYSLQENILRLTATYSGQDELVSALLPGFRSKIEHLFQP
ncbi:MAG TPA: Uma2 family endonuclease [Blastocatellia bacterium]